MGSNIGEMVLTFVMAIVGVSILALIISPKANTVGVIQAGASGVVNTLATAESPVTGATVNIVSDYPSQQTLGFGLDGSYH